MIGTCHLSLQRFNTMGLNVNAHNFLWVKRGDLEELPHNISIRVLGGGSNILFTQDITDHWLIKLEEDGFRTLETNASSVIVEADGGANWHDFVMWTIQQGYYGLENLALIPGTVGAAPIQNIGAYGVEQKDYFHQLEFFHLEARTFELMTASGCQFGYRNSTFKQSLKNQTLITRVRYELHLDPAKIKVDYGAIQQTLQDKDFEKSPEGVAEAVICIRQSKLPDPAILGNCGSFFKNPIISMALFTSLQNKFPEIPNYPVSESQIKVPAGWLIERAGWKGKQVGQTGCYEHQALILVNYGEATGAEIWSHAQTIIQSVEARFGIKLEPEVNIW